MPLCVQRWIKKFCRGFLDPQYNKAASTLFPWSRPTNIEADLGKALTKVAESKHKRDKRNEGKVSLRLKVMDR